MDETNVTLPKKRWFGWKQVLALLVTAGYSFSPIDFLPDVIPFLGWVDDFLVDLVTGIYLLKSWSSVRSQIQAQLTTINRKKTLRN